MLAAAVAALLLAACAHAPAAGTPSGFSIVESAPDPEAAAQVARVLPLALEKAERWGPLAAPVVVTIHPSGEALASATGRPGDAWLRGWSRPGAVDVVSPRGWTRGKASDDALATLLAHELTHCALFQRLGAGWARRDVPAWFEEGMASFTAGERHSRADGAALRPRPAAVSADPAVAYGTADRAFRDLVAIHGEAAVGALLDGLAAGRPFDEAFLSATGSTRARFERALRARLADATAAR